MTLKIDNNKIVPRILIVDDDPYVQEPLRDFFEQYGIIVFTVSNAHDAIDLLNIRSFDVVITDIDLPGMDGLALTTLIKKEYKADVIVITGHTEDYSYKEVIDKGASDFVFKPVHFNELFIRLKRVIKERQLQKERALLIKKLEKLAITDPLTDLNNSRHFFNQVSIEIERSNRYDHFLSIVLLDIDNFKKYNDSYGHLEGDKVLVTLGRIITSHLRNMDSAYRYGGEEFILLLPGTKKMEANTVAERLRVAVESEKLYPRNDKTHVIVTISAGVAQYRQNEDRDSFIKRADDAMYKSKRNGRNRISVS